MARLICCSFVALRLEQPRSCVECWRLRRSAALWKRILVPWILNRVSLCCISARPLNQQDFPSNWVFAANEKKTEHRKTKKKKKTNQKKKKQHKTKHTRSKNKAKYNQRPGSHLPCFNQRATFALYPTFYPSCWRLKCVTSMQEINAAEPHCSTCSTPSLYIHFILTAMRCRAHNIWQSTSLQCESITEPSKDSCHTAVRNRLLTMLFSFPAYIRVNGRDPILAECWVGCWTLVLTQRVRTELDGNPKTRERRKKKRNEIYHLNFCVARDLEDEPALGVGDTPPILLACRKTEIERIFSGLTSKDLNERRDKTGNTYLLRIVEALHGQGHVALADSFLEHFLASHEDAALTAQNQNGRDIFSFVVTYGSEWPKTCSALWCRLMQKSVRNLSN